jgi:hypothetical protein
MARGEAAALMVKIFIVMMARGEAALCIQLL